MFTGIIQTLGKLQQRSEQQGGQRLLVEAGGLSETDRQPGNSIAVNGVCLSVAERCADGFLADLSTETCLRTTLASLPIGSPLNLETALTLQTPLGGHLVTGHVDGIGTVLAYDEEGQSRRLSVRAPAALMAYLCPRGSVCLDGVSLTVTSTEADDFSVNLIPHTLAHTALNCLQPGLSVNIEVDIIARYLERLMRNSHDAPA